MLKNVVIMAGGMSRRFSRDKTIEMFNGKRLIEYPADTFKGRVQNLAVSAKDESKYAFLGLPFIKDIYDVQCPMVGILSALRHFMEPVFVVAADTPFVMYEHAGKLYEAVKNADAAVPFVDGKHHPLYACYNIGMIPVFERAVASEEYRLMQAFSSADVIYLDEKQILSSEYERKAFLNINTQEDLKSIK